MIVLMDTAIFLVCCQG